ncbi:methylosome subunit pICln [Cephus cinctus]|uniref:Methylosome subunit pICln n=1 Tax=Cephus cinctus TaxID=211228 RepID=A0AAJ7BUI3_CEPCN|nr:methylosome subunit pICln [Cephus cinctus]XP_015594732.1 methylosome subunit pICln [Cephus cinctus]XP_015594733.1 methylosome subunit pICln [Cephus cinctus]XP_015594734.1 methylosome subunit pICln [Cephus cinctus]XP_015594735.1 methylosome subunit pICln [Cephus cinctus]XP_024940588.1 methylosome subunit pICln [Cephus cinctus]
MVVLSNFSAPQEGIRHEEPDTTVFINDKKLGKGTLYITDSVLSWMDSETQEGFSLEYPSISLHAISRDEQAHPRHCLYVMVDSKVDLPGSASSLDNSSEHDSEDSNSSASITEMRFAPDNTNNLDAMFQAMNQCQALHPDPQDSFSGAEDEDIYEDAEEDEFDYYEVGAGDPPYLLPSAFDSLEIAPSHNGTESEENMDVEAGQFEDAEEDP